MLVDQLVKVKWNGANKSHYVLKGYKYTKQGDEFQVNINDLSNGSHSLVKFVCDYCEGRNQLEEKDKWKVYKQLLVQRKKNNKDCCNHDKCRMEKHWEMRMVNVSTDKNTLGDKYPHLIEEWSDKNQKSPFEYTVASEYKVWWKCKEKGHEWETHVKNRTVHSAGCPFCSGLYVCKDTSIASTHPQLAQEWHPTKNIDISMFEISKGNSDRKVWWLGKCGHEWESDVSHRVHGRGCPQCKESKGEKVVRKFLEDNEIKFIPQYEFQDLMGIGGKNLKFDFAVFNKSDDLVILIEYDGEFHFNKFYNDDGFERITIHDNRKNEYCFYNKIPLLRIPYWKFKDIEMILQKELYKHRFVAS